MAPGPSAPRTVAERRLLAASLCVLYAVLGYVATRDLPSAISMGLYGGIGITVVLLALVFTWRGVRETVVRRRS